jgi:TRAP-type C4-dicarboxylate transport system substrate-binding protein
MNRLVRGAIAVVVVLVAALGFWLWTRGTSAPPEAAKSSHVWNYSVWGPPRAFTSGIEHAAKIMSESSQGRFELKIHYGGALSPEKENLDAIKVGAVDGAHICFSYFPNKVPMAQVLELAFLLTDDMRVNARVADAVIRHPYVEKELAEQWNTKYFMLVVLPSFEFMSNRRIASVADLHGLRLRVLGGYSLAFQAAGGVPVMVTAPETYTAMERGTMDAVALPWTDSFGAYRMYEVAKYATDGARIPAVSCFSGVSIDAWNALPEQLKAELPRIQEEGMQAYFRAYEEADKKWLPIFRERLEIVPFPRAERDKLVKLAEPMWRKWAQETDAKGLPGTEMLNFAKEQVAKFSALRK